MTDPIREALTRAALRCPDDGELAEALEMYDARAGAFRAALLARVNAHEALADKAHGHRHEGDWQSRYAERREVEVREARAILTLFDTLYDASHPDPGGAGVKVTWWSVLNVWQDGSDERFNGLRFMTKPEAEAFIREEDQRFPTMAPHRVVRVVATVMPEANDTG